MIMQYSWLSLNHVGTWLKNDEENVQKRKVSKIQNSGIGLLILSLELIIFQQKFVLIQQIRFLSTSTSTYF